MATLFLLVIGTFDGFERALSASGKRRVASVKWRGGYRGRRKVGVARPVVEFAHA